MKGKTYEEYKQARDKAWQVLVDCKIDSLPVNVRQLCKQMNIQMYTYHKDFKLIQAFKLEPYTDNDGFCTIINGHGIIFLNEKTRPKQRLFFTAAHEIGHLVMGHLDKGSATISLWNRGEQPPPNGLETQANIFASRLLAPACVLHELGVQTVEELMEVTGLSHTAAKIRMERLLELRKRGKFYTKPLEREVVRQFADFIWQYKSRKRNA